ncbi:hypothetical protein SH528x_000832 [Novipirellula sp. SH528]
MLFGANPKNNASSGIDTMANAGKAPARIRVQVVSSKPVLAI